MTQFEISLLINIDNINMTYYGYYYIYSYNINIENIIIINKRAYTQNSLFNVFYR